MLLKPLLSITILSVGMAFCALGQRTDPSYGKYLRLAARSPVDTARLSILQKLNSYHLNRHVITSERKYLDSALVDAQNAVKVSIKIGDVDRKYESIRLLANTYIAMADSLKGQRCMAQVFSYLEIRHHYAKMIDACFAFAKGANSVGYHHLSANFYKQALLIAQAHQLMKDEVLIKSNILYELKVAGRGDQTSRAAAQLIAQYRNSGQNLAIVYNMLATSYRYRGDLRKALQYGIACIHDVELHNDTLFASNAYGELALIYDVLGEHEKSVVNFRKCLAYRIERPIPEIYIYRTQGFLVKDLITLGRPKEALREVIAFNKIHPAQGEIGKSFCHQNLALCYEALKDYPNAEAHYLKALSSPELKIGGEIMMLAYCDMINFYLLQKQYKLALKYALQVGDVNTSLDNVRRYENLRFKIDSALGQYKSALDHYGKSQKAKDSLLNETKIREVAELQLQYETAQKEKDIALLRKDGQLQRDRLLQSDKIRNITLVGIGFVSLSLMLLYITFLNNRKKSRVIEHKNEALHHLLTEKDGLLEEKQWLIKEIHHRVKNNLQIVMGLLQRQSSFIDNEVALKAIQNSENRMHAIALIHQKLYLSDTLDLINMQEYIDELIMHIKDTADLDPSILFFKQVDLVFLDVSQAVPLGLILNEAITNAIKYAYPDGRDGKIYIELGELAADFIQLTIRDDGAGFKDDFDLTTVQTMGLSLMRGLAKQLGGALVLSQDNGTVIQIKFKALHLGKQTVNGRA